MPVFRDYGRLSPTLPPASLKPFPVSKNLEIVRPCADVYPRMHGINFDEELEKIVVKDPRYTRAAYLFVREALDHTQKVLGAPVPEPGKEDAPRHVTGQQLLEGVREYALAQYGPMAMTVLAEWGIHRCEDIGELVFNMVENSLLAKTEQDSRNDFKGGYDFEEAFRRPFIPQNRLNRKTEVETGIVPANSGSEIRNSR